MSPKARTLKSIPVTSEVFVVGQKVEVNSPNSGLHGKVGEIIKIYLPEDSTFCVRVRFPLDLVTLGGSLDQKGVGSFLPEELKKLW